MRTSLSYVFFIAAALFSVSPWSNSVLALLLGALLINTQMIPKRINISRLNKRLLPISIVGLGFGISIDDSLITSLAYWDVMVFSVIATLLIGVLCITYFRVERQTGYLISVGTAICGGSAIASTSPIIQASERSTATALAAIFIFNALSLFVFPLVGHALDLSQTQFGVWAAIAVHDTSSVIATASIYGEEALTTATTLKLIRTLWIVPVLFFSAWFFRSSHQRFSLPWFIFGYVAAILANDWIPFMQNISPYLFLSAKKLLGLCIFLMGCSLTYSAMQQAHRSIIFLAGGLWLFVSSSSLAWIIWLHP